MKEIHGKTVKVKSRADHFNCSLSTVASSRFFPAVISWKEQSQTGVVMDLETLLASSCRRKILKALSSSGRTNVMELVRKVNSTYNQVNSNLQILQEEGIITDQHVGRMRIVRLNGENPKIRLLLQALKTLSTPTETNNKQSGGKMKF